MCEILRYWACNYMAPKIEGLAYLFPVACGAPKDL